MVGRKIEIGRIQRLLNSKRSEFLAITGRRRVGKTFLIDSVLQPHYCFSMTGIQKGSIETQLVNFNVKLSEYSGKVAEPPSSNWQQAFIQLKAYLKTLDKKKKQVLFIDELPWVSTKRSGFLQMLAHLWNDYLSKETHFLLVICGSATSWITKHVLNDQGGLHNRVTEEIHLYPFTLSETKAFLKKQGIRLTNQDIARIYMVFGGIPFYLEKIERGESFPVAVERICFSPNGPLRNEYENLYKALFNNVDVHQSIVAELAAHRNGMSNTNILKKLGKKSTGSFHRAMSELVHSDFVMENQPFGKKKRGTFFRLMDEYTLFYHRFIKPNHKYTPGLWQQLASQQAFKIWAGYAFESLCHKHIEAIKDAIGISAVYSEISSMFIPKSAENDGFQIDLLIDRNDNSINLCEIKFHAAPFTITSSYYYQLLEKRQRFIDFTGTKKQVFLTFITNHGVVKNEFASELVDVEITLDDLLD